jgi:hypothetical protein
MATPEPDARPRWSTLLLLVRPLPLLLLVAAFLAPPGAAHRLTPERRTEALVLELARLGLESDARDVHWLDEPRGALASRRERSRVLLRARHAGEAWDVYLARARLSPEGALLGLEAVFDLTRTSAVSENLLGARGEHAAWAIGDGQRTYRIELADLRGEPPEASGDWTPLARLQRAITSLQRTGQAAGVGRRSFKLDPAARNVEISLEADQTVVLADDNRIAIPWDASHSIEGQRFVREEERGIARPGSLVTWAVDRVRDLSWFGDDRMQLTKAIAYAALDRIDRALGTIRSPEAADSATEGLGDAAGPVVPTDPETGWPPTAIPPPIEPPLADEGKWFLLDKDPFVRTSAAVPAPLVTTYLRADGARPDSRVYIVMWDPRLVELDMVPGTEEPQSATGETGDGMIPRRPELLGRVVAAFNGAFQATHGDFGMMVGRRVIVPPKPYAATIARLEGGVTGFGTWPRDLTILGEFVSFRQNLTPLVAGGKLNPYGREWWGGVPHDWEDETHTVRSGLCLTREGFVAYFYGTKIDHVHLGRAMISTRCEYGVHLDMNQGHTGIELYRADEARSLPPLSDKLDGHWQAEGDVVNMPGWRFRGRRLLRNMQLMHFPRYIRRGARDYFYLMLRPLLPRPPLTIGAREPGEGVWSLKDLPQHGFPSALATTAVRPDAARPEAKVRVLEVDPALLRAARREDAGTDVVLAVEPPGSAEVGGLRLWLGGERAAIAEAPPAASSLAMARGLGDPSGPVVAAVGVDVDGKIVYAEVVTAADPARDGAVLAAVLADAGCTARLFLAAPLAVALGGTRDLSYHPVRLSPRAIRLVRGPTPGARRLFPETPILPAQEWMPLQRQTRWFPKEPEPGASASSEAPPAAP